MNKCTSCGVTTDWICERDDLPLCNGCECVHVFQYRGYRHVFKGPGTPFYRYYMSMWPRHLPPPKTKNRARAAVEVTPFVEHMLDSVCHALAPAWDRCDALLAVAEIATRLHARDARVTVAWNEYVKRENAKRRKRKLKGWRNNYFNRMINPEERYHD